MLVDWIVGQVLEALQRNGIEEQTLLIATSDNGGRLTDVNGRDFGHKTNGDWRGQKADIWDGGHREPLVAMWPGRIAPGTVRSDIVCLGDFMATCAEIVGGTLPEDAAEDSFSLLPVLTGKPGTSGRQSIVHHSYDGMFSIRKEEWKLIEGVGSGGFSEPARYTPAPGEAQGQLYNIARDHRETLNLWKRHPEVVEELTGLLDTCRREGRS